MIRTDLVKEFILKNRMMEKGDVVCVGLSGGADSVCLLYFLSELSEALGIRLIAYHVNHMLRGTESDQDEEFVRELCEKKNIPLYAVKKDVRFIAREMKTGLEEAGRLVRRSAAKECMAKYNGTKNALAHNKNDCAETMLFNMARGSSLKGLCGIMPVAGSIIRPLLCLTRTEIEEELKTIGQSFRTDSSNLTDEYTRNRIRHHILPVFEKEINEKAVCHFADEAEDLREISGFVFSEAKNRQQAYVSCTDSNSFELSEKLLLEMPVIQRVIAKNVLEKAAGASKNISRVHVEELLRLFSAEAGKKLSLPYGLTGIKEYGRIFVGREPVHKQESFAFLCQDEKTEFEEYVFSCEVIPNINISENIIEKTYTKCFDYDKILGDIVIRHRMNGDYFTVNKDGGHKKLSDYFTDKKIPLRKREAAVLLAKGSHIIWAVGLRISEEFKITEKTKRVLRVSCSKKE